MKILNMLSYNRSPEGHRKTFLFLVFHFPSLIWVVFSPVFMTWELMGNKNVAPGHFLPVPEFFFLHLWKKMKKNLEKNFFSPKLFWGSGEKKCYQVFSQKLGGFGRKKEIILAKLFFLPVLNAEEKTQTMIFEIFIISK